MSIRTKREMIVVRCDDGDGGMGENSLKVFEVAGASGESGDTTLWIS